MSEKNPYENQETVDIPKFSSANKASVNTSSFDVDEEDYDDEEYYDDEPTYLKVRKPVVVVTIILIVVLLGVSLVSLISASKAKKEVTAVKEEYEAYKQTALANENALNEKIAILQAQSVTPSTNPSSGQESKTANYVVEVDELSVRVGPGTDNDYAGFDSLPEELKGSCKDNSGNAITYKGAMFKVLETKTNSNGSIWGKVGDNVWICLNDGSQDYCKKQ